MVNTRLTLYNHISQSSIRKSDGYYWERDIGYTGVLSSIRCVERVELESEGCCVS